MKTLISALLLLCTASSAFCATSATIEYSHLGNCHVYATSGTSTTGAGNGFFMLYRINVIENSSGSSSAFQFKVNRLFVDNIANNLNNNGANILITNKATDKSVPVGTKITGVGKLFIRVPLSGNLQLQKLTTKLLKYNPSSASETVFLVKKAPSPAWMDPCTSSFVNSWP
jgi:hypothetical protein